MASDFEGATFYRTRTQLPAYDAARWLQPPPKVALAQTFSSGLKCVLQVGASASSDKVQEALVSDRLDDSLILFPDGTSAFDLYLGARPTQPQAAAGLAAMGASVQARWVAQPTQARMVQVHIPKALGDAYLGLDFDGRYRRLTESLTRLVREFASDLTLSGSDDLLVESWLHLLLRKMRTEVDAPAAGGLAPWQIRRATELMQSRLAERLSLPELARAAGVSVFHFARQFKRSQGMPPHAYLMRLRLEAAQRLLAFDDASMTEIARATGFADYRFFARSFKSRFGASPGDYRRRARGS